MIEFEGFGLENTEQNIINKQFSSQPLIMKQFMKALGAREGSSSTKRYEWQTEDQKDLWADTLEGYKNLEYKGAGEYNEGKKADELEGFKATDMASLRKLKEEGRLSLAGLEKLRTYGATAATQVNPDIEGLRNLGKGAWQGYDAHLAETTREARRRLNAADIASRRGAGTGGTALTRGIAANIGEYGTTVGRQSAMLAEASAMNRQRLAMEGYQRAGSLGLAATGQGLQGLQSAGQLELGELGLTAQDLAQRRGIHSGEKQYMAQNELQRARYSHEQAQARNLWQQQNAQAQNQWQLQALAGKSAAANTRTFEDVVTKTPGTAGFGGTLIKTAGTVAGAYLGGPVGAQIGGSLAGGIVDSSGNWGGGGGSYARSGGGGTDWGALASQGLQAYAAGGGFNQTGGGQVPPSMRGMGNRPQTEYGMFEDDPNSGWWDTWGQTNAQTQLNIGERNLAAQNWDTRLRNRTQYVNQQLAPRYSTTPNQRYGDFNYNDFFNRGARGNNPNDYYARWQNPSNIYAPQGYGAS